MSYAFVTSHNGSNTGTTPTLAITVTAGQSLICLTADTAQSGSTITCTDNSGSNTYVARKQQNAAFDGFTCELFDCLSPVAGTYTISVSSNAGTPAPNFWVLVYTNLTSFDNVVSNAASSGWATSTNGVLSPNLTPVSQPGMLLGWAISGTGTLTAGTVPAFNSRAVSVGGFSNNVAEDIEYTSTAATNSVFTTGTANSGIAIYAATYLEPAGPPPTPLFYNRKNVLYFIN